MIYLLLGIIVIALDQFTKYLVRGMESDEVIHVIGDFLRIVHVENSGAAFGLFEGSRRFLLIFPAVIIAGAVYLIFKDLGSDLKGRLSKVSLALVASGGIGNMIDRFLYGYDFIQHFSARVQCGGYCSDVRMRPSDILPDFSRRRREDGLRCR